MKAFSKLLFLLLASVTLFAQPRFSGYVQNWTAYNLNDENELFLLRNRFRLNTTLSGDWARGYASVDLTEQRQFDRPLQETNLRELYLDLYFERFDLRIGRQQVIWGKADGVFINDIVNPMDLRYFLMQDFDDIRMAVNMLKFNAYAGDWGLEALFIPKFEPWKFAEPGSPWEFDRPDSTLMTMDMGTVPLYFNFQQPLMPEKNLANGEFGLKLTGFILGADVSLLYLNSFQDQTVAQADSIRISFSSAPPVGNIYLTPVFDKVAMYGFNFSRPFGGTMLRGEFGYFDGFNFNIAPEVPEDPSAIPDNIITSGYFQGMLGADISGPWGSSLSLQYIRKQILDYHPAIMNFDEVEEMMTFMVSGTFWNEDASIRSLTLYDMNNESGLSRLIFTYKLDDGVSLETGSDIIWGQAGSFIGQFDRNDNVYAKLVYSF